MLQQSVVFPGNAATRAPVWYVSQVTAKSNGVGVGEDGMVLKSRDLLASLVALGNRGRAWGAQGGQGEQGGQAMQGGGGGEGRVKIGLIGFPNVGKSSLVNALAEGRRYLCRKGLGFRV
jgi:hypothetical protein